MSKTEPICTRVDPKVRSDGTDTAIPVSYLIKNLTTIGIDNWVLSMHLS